MTSIQHTTYTHTHRSALPPIYIELETPSPPSDLSVCACVCGVFRHVSGCLCSSRRALFRVPDGTTIRVTRSPPLLPLKQALPYLERQYASHLLSLRPA
jgi:hypothetical protein